jgi:hypothetical protein
VTAVGPASLMPVGTAAAAPTDAGGDAAKFERALAHAPSNSPAPVSSTPLGGGGQASSSKDFTPDTSALTAADDAWVRFLAVSEQLQNPSLPAAAKDSLVKQLAVSWRSFRSQSDPIIRQLDDYMASKDGVPAGEPRT